VSTEGPASDRGQSTVEFALLLPLLVVLFLVVLQAALVARDQVRLTRATSAAARAAMVEPEEAAARHELAAVAGGLAVRSVSLSGSRSPGSLLTVTVTARPTRVPVVGLAVTRLELSERLVVRVEG
jgi:Flp pilus assembly protein TadG